VKEGGQWKMSLRGRHEKGKCVGKKNSTLKKKKVRPGKLEKIEVRELSHKRGNPRNGKGVRKKGLKREARQ